jgi:DNA-binding SARP family transcriptional activator
VLKAGRPVYVRGGGKTHALLVNLSVRRGYSASRDALLETLWPSGLEALSRQSLNSLIHGLHRLLGDAIGGAAPVLSAGGYCRLNVEAGVRVDVACFDSLVRNGDREARSGNVKAAAASYRHALCLYRGDLCIASDSHSVVERERVRTLYLTLLAHLADYHYADGDYAACLDATLELLAADPCREDGHRIAMRCHVRRGERSQALRQYQLCEAILRAEFDVAPEPATVALFNQVRLAPENI